MPRAVRIIIMVPWSFRIIRWSSRRCAIAQGAEEARPEVRDPDELHDALLSLIWVPEDQAPEWKQHIAALVDTGRAAVITAGQSQGWVATERLEHVRAVFPAFVEGTPS